MYKRKKSLRSTYIQPTTDLPREGHVCNVGRSGHSAFQASDSCWWCAKQRPQVETRQTNRKTHGFIYQVSTSWSWCYRLKLVCRTWMNMVHIAVLATNRFRFDREPLQLKFIAQRLWNFAHGYHQIAAILTPLPVFELAMTIFIPPKLGWLMPGDP